MYRSANDTSKSNEANADKSADHPYPHSKPVLSSSEKGTTNTQVTVGHPTSITATPTDSRGASTVILPTVLQMPDRTACTGYSQRINGLKRFVEHLQHCASTQSNNMRVSGWLLLGQDVRAIRNSQRIDCEASEARWQVLAQGRKSAWWRVAWCAALGAPLAGLCKSHLSSSLRYCTGANSQYRLLSPYLSLRHLDSPINSHLSKISLRMTALSLVSSRGLRQLSLCWASWSSPSQVHSVSDS